MGLIQECVLYFCVFHHFCVLLMDLFVLSEAFSSLLFSRVHNCDSYIHIPLLNLKKGNNWCKAKKLLLFLLIPYSFFQ